MNVVITKVDYPYVSFSSDYGDGIVFTTGRKFELGTTHGVEFDLLSDLNAGENTTVGTNRKEGFYIEDDCMIIVAVVENIFEDDAMWLRIAMDCHIETYQVGNTIKIGDKLEVRMPSDKFMMTSIGTLFK